MDVLELEMGEAIHLSDLKVPEGVEIAALLHGGDPSQPVVSVHAPRVEVEETPVVAEDGEAAATEEAPSDSDDAE